MTKEMFEKACILHAEMDDLINLEMFFMNCTKDRQLCVKDINSSKIINTAVISDEITEIVLSAIRNKFNLKMQEFKNL